MATLRQDLGPVTAYAYAVSEGYTGTEEEYAELMASYATVAEAAAGSASDAADSASDAEAYGAGTRGGSAVESGDEAYHNNAKYYAESAADDASTVASAVNSFMNITVPAAVQSVTDEGTTQIGLVQGEGTTQIGLVSGEGTTQVGAVEAKGAEVLGSIPEDYTKLSDDVSDLKSAFNDVINTTYTENRLNPSSQIGADINTTTGAVTQNDYYSVSGKMLCEEGESLYFVKNTNGVFSNEKSSAYRMAFYASDDSFIEIQQDESPFTVPENAAYCLMRTNKNQIVSGDFGIFPYSATQLSVWIPYAEIKAVEESALPSSAKEEFSKMSKLEISPEENLLNPSDCVLSQLGTSNIISTRWSVEGDVTYTMSYSGAVDNGTSGWVRFYDADNTYLSQIAFPFKQGFVTYTTPNNAKKAELYFYNTNGMDVSTFTFAAPCVVYGATKSIKYVAFNERLSASSIPSLPDITYARSFDSLISYAHMGQSQYFPQNTIWSWLGAKKSGFDYIECDLQVTADNKIVLIHDPDMRRYGGTASQTVASLTLAQLQTFDAGAWFNKAYDGTAFPVFDDFVGMAKALGIRLALDCKTIDTAERIDAVASILEKWGMLDEVVWITSAFYLTWSRVPNAKIVWAAGATLVNGSYSDTVGGWFTGMASNWPADKKVTKTITIKVNGVDTQITAEVPADGVYFGVLQDHLVADTYGLSDLQLTGQYAKAFNCHFGLYAVDDDDDMYGYIQSIPELEIVESNRTTAQAATCRKFGIGLSDRPQNIGKADFT